MTTTLYETIRRIVVDELAGVRLAALAVVQEAHPADPDNYACTVVLRDSGLVLQKVPVATGRIGSVCLPEPGQLVLVQFLEGDANAPIIAGRLYSEEDRPPANDVGTHVTHLPAGAKDDEAIHVELQAGQRSLLLRLGTGLEVTLADADPAVEVKVGTTATLSIAKDGAVELSSQGAITVKGAEVTLEAQGALKLKGATVDVN